MTEEIENPMHDLSKHDFFKWCMAQPTDQSINHKSGWCGCAVGDWVKAIDIYPKDAFDYDPDPESLNDLYEVDDCPVFNILQQTVSNPLHTYGHLQDLITEHYPEYGETK